MVGDARLTLAREPKGEFDLLLVYAFSSDSVPAHLLTVEAMRGYPSLLEPLLFYVLHRVTARVLDAAEAATLKLCVMDEAWRFIQHPTLRAYVQEGLKTWRKRNAAMILSTQAIDDFASADLLRTVVESCPTKLLLANPALDPRQYADLILRALRRWQ